ncbi:hypothetical protein [Streptomyces sp. TRM68367]|uniref:hypothetical protein n=1 Tax=Streptomyces sp. TRM68367 TaxID=2758415 RepID=UPI00165AD715|nr:hypothetical protein [Streptomyces sp. TRM68367]MBC9731228.1 hypothetical protein [Streptomyces sp. TRM68367]
MSFLDGIRSVFRGGPSSAPPPRGISPYASTTERDKHAKKQARYARQAAARRAGHRARVNRGGVDSGR